MSKKSPFPPPPQPLKPLKTSKNSKAKFRMRRMLAIIVICIALSVGTVMGVLATTYGTSSSPVDIKTIIFDPLTGKSSEIYQKKQEIDPMQILLSMGIHSSLDRKINLLVMGSDYNYYRGKRLDEKETGMPSRTDTMILVSLDPQRNQVSMLNIPRDTRALLTGHHYDKINSAMTYGGVDLAKSTVSDLTGVPIDYYMQLKVDGLINTVDILGGIRMYVEKDMYYVDETAHLGINIHKGWKEAMNGEQAHQYVRFRKDELGDIGRVQRQQKFISALIEKLKKPSSWTKVPELVRHMNENITTDIPPDVLGQIIKFGASLEKENIKMVMYPGTFSTGTAVSYWLPNYNKASEIIMDLFPETSLKDQYPGVADDLNGQDLATQIRRARVSVWNGTKDYAVGREVIKRLRKAGWNVWAVRKAPVDSPKTQYVAQTGKNALLTEIQGAIGYRAERVSASVGDIATDYTVIIGEDLVKHLRRTMTNNQFADYHYDSPAAGLPAYEPPAQPSYQQPVSTYQQQTPTQERQVRRRKIRASTPANSPAVRQPSRQPAITRQLNDLDMQLPEGIN